MPGSIRDQTNFNTNLCSHRMKTHFQKTQVKSAHFQNVDKVNYKDIKKQAFEFTEFILQCFYLKTKVKLR